MKDQLKMSFLPTLPGTHSATSSPASASGHSPSEVPVCRTTIPSGQEAALASLSARQAKAQGLLTSGTCGLRSTTSSASASLQTSLESRLRAKTVLAGWSLYKLTWKERATPSGLRISALRASPLPKVTGEWAAHISASVSTGAASGWATPTTRDHKSGGADLSSSVVRKDGKIRNDLLDYQAWFAGWPTPTAALADKGVRTFEGALKEAKRSRGPDLAAMVSLTGYPAGTGKLGRLRAGHSRWLMRIPNAWDACAPTVTRSTRRPRKPL